MRRRRKITNGHCAQTFFWYCSVISQQVGTFGFRWCSNNVQISHVVFIVSLKGGLRYAGIHMWNEDLVVSWNVVSFLHFWEGSSTYDVVGDWDTRWLYKLKITSKIRRDQQADHSIVSPRNSVIWFGMQIWPGRIILGPAHCWLAHCTLFTCVNFTQEEWWPLETISVSAMRAVRPIATPWCDKIECCNTIINNREGTDCGWEQICSCSVLKILWEYLANALLVGALKSLNGVDQFVVIIYQLLITF